MSLARFGIVALFTVVATGCSGGPFSPGMCTLELGMHLTPAEATIAVGQSVTPKLELTSCGGRKRWTPTVVWLTTDTAVVSVDSITGQTTGRASGSAHVTPVEHASNGDHSYIPLLVHVQ